jgi:hypothetical protein
VIGHGGVAGDELADSGAIDVGHFAQVQQQLLIPGGGHITDHVAERAGSFTQSNPAYGVNHRYVPYLPASQFYTHDKISLNKN